MTSTQFDALPRSVLVVSDAEYEEISHTPGSVAALQDPESAVIPFSSTPVANRAIVDAVRSILRSTGQLASGTLWILDPYEARSYVNSTDAIQTFVVAKYHHLAVIASLLGATSMKIDSKEVERNRTKMGGNFRLGVKVFGSQGSGTADIEKALDEQLQLETVFAGSLPDREAALEYIREHKLASDHTFTALVDMRNDRNPVREYSLMLNGTKEAQTNIQAALKITVAVPSAVNFSGDFAMTAHSISDVKIRTTITFDE
jgi:hypothetical protein